MNFLDDLAVNLISSVLEARTGQTITEDRRWRVSTVLGPLFRHHDISSGSQLIAAITRGGESDRFISDMVDALLNNETYFYRDMVVFRNLQEKILPDLARRHGRRRRLKIWSAGCSTGQEAVSLAMMFLDQPQRWADWQIEIVATDVSANAIACARAGIYSQFEIQRGLGVAQMLKHFDETPAGWLVNPRISRMIRYSEGNFLENIPRPGQFDLVLCRNVLLYFDAARRTAAFEQLALALESDGLLLLGGGETAGGHSGYFAPCDDAFGLYSLIGRPGNKCHSPKKLA